MIAGGLRAVLTCVDPRQLPESVDPCGERGEFHTFAWAGSERAPQCTQPAYPFGPCCASRVAVSMERRTRKGGQFLARPRPLHLRCRAMRFGGQWHKTATAVAIVCGAGCARQLAPPTAAFSAPATAHVRVRVQLDGSASAPAAVASGETPVPLFFHWVLAQKPAGSTAALTNIEGPAPRFVPDLAGAYVVRLTVSDFAHESAPVAHTVEAGADCAPQIVSAAAASASVDVGQPVALSGSVAAPCSDSADTVVSVRWSVEAAPPSSSAGLIGASRLNASFVPDVRGAYDLALRATDALGFTSAPQHVLLSVASCGDNVPQVNALTASPPAPGLGAPVQLTAAVSDADAQPPCALPRTYAYAWSFASVPKGSAAQLSDPAAQTPSLVPDVAGDYLVSLVASDQNGRAGSAKTITISASACGGATPVATATGPGSLKSGDVAQLHVAVADADVDVCGLPVTFSYQWQAVAAPQGSAARLNDAHLENPSFVADLPGTYAFSVVATSSNGHASTAALVAVQAGPCGSVPPVVQQILAPSGATGAPLQLSALIADANTCKVYLPFRYRWTLTGAPAGSAAQLSAAGADGTSAQSQPSLTPDLNGSYTVRLDVTDALGLVAAPVTQSFTVARCNAPLSAAIVAPAGAQTGTPVQPQAQVTDNNDPVICARAFAPYAYRWSIAGAPSGSTARLNNAAAAAPSFVPDVAGSYTLRLVVVDAAGNASPAASADVVVANCAAPLSATIAATPAAVATGGVVALGLATLSDPNAGCAPPAPLSYAWSMVSAPAGSVAQLNNPLAAAPSFVADTGHPGDTYLVQLVVADGLGNRSPPALVSIPVASCSGPPAVAIAPASGPTGQPIALSATITPQDAACAPLAPYSYSWSLVGRPPGSVAALNNTGASSPSFTPDVAGAYVVTAVVRDATGGASAPASQNIAVANCSAPLSNLTASLTGTATTGSTLTLLAAPNDPNTGSSCPAITPIGYRWSLVAAPAGSKAGLATPLAISTALLPDLAGTYVAQVYAVDALGNAGTALKSFAVASCGSGGSVVVNPLGASPAAPILGQAVTLSAPVNDGNGSCGASVAPFAYAWSLTPPSGSGATLSNASAAQPVFRPDLAGAYAFSVTVTDALGYQSSKSGSITASACTLTATVTAPSGIWPDYLPVQLAANVAASPVGCGGTLAYRWSFDTVPPGSAAAFNSATVSDPSFTPDAPSSTWTARVNVTGAAGVAATATASVTSNACGSQLPVATAGISLPFPISVNAPQPNPNVGSTVQYLLTSPPYQLQLDGSGSAQALACNAPLSWSWTVYKKPLGSSAQVYPVNAVKPVFTPDVLGDYIFQLAVSDGRFASAPSYLRITLVDPLQDNVAGVSSGVIWNDLEAPDPTRPSVSPAIAYYENNGSGYDLMYSQCTANCASATPTFATQIVEAGALASSNTLLATDQVSLKFLGGGVPIVAYRYDPNCQMRYALFDGTSWVKSVIDQIGGNSNGTTNCVGGLTSIHGEIELLLVGASQTVAVSYHSHLANTPRARYAICSGAGCKGLTGSRAWTAQDVDTTNNPGHFMTAYVDPISLNPRLAYARENTADLWFASCAGTCDTPPASNWTWSIGQVEGTGGGVTYAGEWNSIALAPSGTVGIAYEDVGTDRVRFATCAPAAGNGFCTGGAGVWTHADIAALAAGNYFPSLQFDALDLAHITFVDSANSTLRYAIQTGANAFQYFDIDHQVDDGHSSFILTPLGSTHVSYSLTTGLKYYPFGD